MAKNSGRDNVIDTTGLFVYAVASLAVTLSVTKGLCQVEGNCTNCQSLKLHILISGAALSDRLVLFKQPAE